MEPIWQTQLIVELRFSSVKIKQLRRFKRFYLLRVSTSKISPKQKEAVSNCWNCLRLLNDFRDDLDFRISGFPYFRFTCQPAFDGLLEGLFEVVALKSQFSDPK